MQRMSERYANLKNLFTRTFHQLHAHFQAFPEMSQFYKHTKTAHTLEKAKEDSSVVYVHEGKNDHLLPKLSM